MLLSFPMESIRVYQKPQRQYRRSDVSLARRQIRRYTIVLYVYPFRISERIAEFYRVVYRGASEVKFYKIIHTFVWFVLRLVDIFRRDVHKWQRKRNVSCGNVANIRVKDVNARGTNTLEESQNFRIIKCRKLRQRLIIRQQRKVI